MRAIYRPLPMARLAARHRQAPRYFPVVSFGAAFVVQLIDAAKTPLVLQLRGRVARG
jgi:hypothetical protein